MAAGAAYDGQKRRHTWQVEFCYDLGVKLKDLGFYAQLQEYCVAHAIDTDNVGRVIAEHKGRYIVKTVHDEYSAEVTGKLMHAAEGRASFPAAGDWAELEVLDDSAVMRSILPRHSTIERRAVGGKTDIQIIATNVDYGLIVQALDRDFNINRLERYITICRDSGVVPIIILSKADLVDPVSIASFIKDVKDRIKQTDVYVISNETKTGYEVLTMALKRGKTYCLLGSSGVGKSTLLNNLLGKNTMETGAVGSKTHRGRHVTTHRELIVLESGGILIDNPGMREVGISDAGEGLERTFDDIADLVQKCRFKDCSHAKEKGCAVLQALKEGRINQESYNNYYRMQREVEHYESSVFERRKKAKAFGKMVKNAKKDTLFRHH